MSYIGLEPSNSFVSLKRQVITGNGGTSYTLDHSVASVNDVAIFVNNVRQDPAGYSISGAALTLGGTIESSDDCYVIFLGQALQTVTPDANTITTAMIQDNAVTTAKITDANVSSAKMFSGFANGITEYDMYRLSASTVVLSVVAASVKLIFLIQSLEAARPDGGSASAASVRANVEANLQTASAFEQVFADAGLASARRPAVQRAVQRDVAQLVARVHVEAH